MIGYGLAVLYGVVTVIFLIVTFAEGARDGRRWDRMRVAGIALCFLWPVVAAVLVFLACMGKWGRNTVRRFVQGPSVRYVQADD